MALHRRAAGKKRDNEDSDVSITVVIPRNNIIIAWQKVWRKVWKLSRRTRNFCPRHSCWFLKTSAFWFSIQLCSWTPMHMQVTLCMWTIEDSLLHGSDSTTKMYSSPTFWWSTFPATLCYDTKFVIQREDSFLRFSRWILKSSLYSGLLCKLSYSEHCS